VWGWSEEIGSVESGEIDEGRSERRTESSRVSNTAQCSTLCPIHHITTLYSTLQCSRRSRYSRLQYSAMQHYPAYQIKSHHIKSHQIKSNHISAHNPYMDAAVCFIVGGPRASVTRSDIEKGQSRGDKRAGVRRSKL
jgi:hypothetical protein